MNVVRIICFYLALWCFTGCDRQPGMQLSIITVQVNDSCEEDIEEHTVRIWARQNPNDFLLVLSDSIIMAPNTTRELSFLALDKSYFQLVGTGDCRSTWTPINLGQRATQELTYTSALSYLTVDISSVNGDERDSLEIQITRFIDGVQITRLPGDESNHFIQNISYADLPIDSLPLTFDGYYQIYIFNLVNGSRNLQASQNFHANMNSINLDF